MNKQKTSMKDINPLNLSTPNGFDAEFYKLLADPAIKTQIQAFNILNDIYTEATGSPRYSDYVSYRVTKNRRLRK